MGMRANLIVITDRGRELYYSHWSAATLDRDLFWGPTDATAFARQQRSESEGAELLDEFNAEGAAIIDHTTRTLLWFGGEDLDYDLPQRRVLLQLMNAFWPGWTIRWAFEGIAEIADYLGVSRDAVLTSQPKNENPSWVLEMRADDTYVNTVISSHRDGRCHFFALSEGVDEILTQGGALIDQLAVEVGPSSLDWAARTTGFPSGGLHADLEEHRLGFWFTGESPAIGARSRSQFPGWTVEWWRDDYEAHVRSAPGLVLPSWDEREETRFLFECLLQEVTDFSNTIAHVTPWVLRAKASALDVARFSDASPFALRHDPLRLSVEERRRRLAEHFGPTFVQR